MYKKQLYILLLIFLNIGADQYTKYIVREKVVPGTRTNINQSAEIVERGIEMYKILLDRIDPHLSKNKFLFGDKFSIADITGHFMFNLSNILKIDFEQNYKNIYRWKLEIESRPSNPIADNN